MKNEQIDEKLKELGVNDIRFYYKTCPIFGNLYSVCLLISKDKKLLARGVSIRSLLDSHDKKVARSKSKGRAIEALINEGNFQEIRTYNRRIFAEEFCVTYKIKNANDKENLISKISMNELFMWEPTKDGKKIQIYTSYFYPSIKAYEDFKFKSEYSPEPTENEIYAFKLQ